MATKKDLEDALNAVLWQPVVTQNKEKSVPPTVASSWRNNVWQLQSRSERTEEKVAKLEALVKALADKLLTEDEVKAAAEAGAKAALDARIAAADVTLTVNEEA